MTNPITRRQFGGAAALLLSAPTQALRAATNGPAATIDETLRDGLRKFGIPCVAAMVATADRTLYTGAFGKRDAATNVDITPDTIFQIASMTKAITTVAAMQMVEQGRVKLDEPASRHLPQLANLQILQGFDASGKPVLRPATRAVTLRHLLTHTSGFAYPTWHEGMFRYTQATEPLPAGVVAPPVPLMFEPGTRWQYGYSVDWAGKLVEAVSGMSLEDYFQRNILKPLGMKDTSFIFDSSKFDRLVGRYQRQPDGALQPVARAVPPPPREYNGGGGLSSTVGDYTKFMQMILRYGRGGVKDDILRGPTVEMMMQNQIGDLTAGKLKTYMPALSSDVDLHPGFNDKWGLGFLLNPIAYSGGRSAGSLAWAGVYNTFYWIDPSRGICATIMMQLLPFVDKDAVALLSDFERAVYRSV